MRHENRRRQTHDRDRGQQIQRNPKYQELRSKRNRLGLVLTVLMLIVYYGYVALIAFDKEFLAQPIGAGVTTLGIPIGMGVIVFTVIITGSMCAAPTTSSTSSPATS
jgi:uncharacterized membrane protein (DUF485 family)